MTDMATATARALQYRQRPGARGTTLRAVPDARGLSRGQHLQPVLDGFPCEVGPRPRRFDQRTDIALQPQGEQGAPRRIGQPAPQHRGDLREPILRPPGRVDRGQQGQFLGAGPGEQRAYQAVLAAEQVEQDPRAGTDGRRQRAQ
jgi:hypothetical protein